MKLKRLQRMLKAKSYCTWSIWFVDYKLFTNEQEATDFARRLAYLRNEVIWIERMEVPSSLLRSKLNGVSKEDPLPEAHSMPPAMLYFVQGRPFASRDEAKSEARTLATQSGERVAVMHKRIKMTDVDFEIWCNPKEESEPAEA